MLNFTVESIDNPSIIKDLTIDQLNELAGEIRKFLIEKVSHTGGHLSSNLGVVELTCALHYVFNSPTDKIFFDVGHQSYVHKILTGRAKDFDTLRQYQGLSGFQKRNESIHDPWEAGHSSTALSAAVGMASARDLNHLNYHIIPVIGDAAMVGGESLEALDDLGGRKSKVIIVLNDNQMSISKNTGGFSEFLSRVRTSNAYNTAKNEYKELMSKSKFGDAIFDLSAKAKNIFKQKFYDSKMFGEFGVDYLGPVDGHDFKDLIRTFNKAKELSGSVVVHVLTTKGKGYPFAENDKTGTWHGVDPFNIETGEPLNKNTNETFGGYVAKCVEEMMDEDEDICAITPAMVHGSKLKSIFKHYPDRSFDVGIAEAHASTFAAGLAVSGKKPFISLYSSFLQRAYDQLNHDIARMNLNVLVGIDRAGLVGGDGETHHGIYDVSLLKDIPNTTIFEPTCKDDTKWFIQHAFTKGKGLQCLRYPKADIQDIPCDISKYEIGKWQIAYESTFPKAILITYGPSVNQAKTYILENNLNVLLVNACFFKPLDEALICQLGQMNLPIYIYEVECANYPLAKDIEHILFKNKIFADIRCYGLQDKYYKQGNTEKILEENHLNLKYLFENMEIL